VLNHDICLAGVIMADCVCVLMTFLGVLAFATVPAKPCAPWPILERELFIDNLLIRIHFIIEMIWWTGLAPWEFEFPFPGSLITTFLSSVKVWINCI